MKVLLSKTLKNIRKKGCTNTINGLLLVSLRELNVKLHFIPNQTIVTVNGSLMQLNPKHDHGIHRDLYLFKHREPLCTQFFTTTDSFVKKGDCVLDIGANIGYYTLLESRKVGEKGLVYAIEPVKKSFNYLKQNITLNNQKNVQTYNFAFGSKKTTSKIYLSTKSNLCALREEAVGGALTGSQEVTQLTVDEFLKGKRKPDLIRMDVEGYEDEIIKGMTETISRPCKILMEMHPLPNYMSQKNLNEMLQILEKNNFKIKYIIYSTKTLENKIICCLQKQLGSPLPFAETNISYDRLKQLLKENEHIASPNVLFEKEMEIND